MKKMIMSFSVLLCCYVFGQPLTGELKEVPFGEVLNESREKYQLEERLRQTRINAKVREEELRLERETQDRLNPVVTPSPLPDLNKAPKWREVAAKEEFKALPPEKQAEAKAAYFDYWIAPHAQASGANVGTERERFLASPKAEPSPIEREFTAKEMLYGALLVASVAVLYFFRRGIGGAFVIALSNDGQSTFAENIMKLNISLAIALVIVILWMFRWDIVAVPRGDGFGYAYKLDRFTGTVYMLRGSTSSDVKPEKSTP